VTPTAIEDLLQPYLLGLNAPESGWLHIYEQLTVYLDLILKWNARTNLTAIRSPQEIVRRHFGESLFAGGHLGLCTTALDFGSGAGFPGIPIQLLRPDLQVTLGESQGKKAAFLREVCRELGLKSEVFPARIETLPPDRLFDMVVMRAVDNMAAAIAEATRRASGQIAILTTFSTVNKTAISAEFVLTAQIGLPLSDDRFLQIFAQRSD
jgi:16S rRNA (guanine527-N7)-methyltransferase